MSIYVSCHDRFSMTLIARITQSPTIRLSGFGLNRTNITPLLNAKNARWTMNPTGLCYEIFMRFLSISSLWYTILLICRSDRSNSSARGSKWIPSRCLRFKMFRSLSLRTHSSIRCSISDRDKPNLLKFILHILRAGSSYYCVK